MRKVRLVTSSGSATSVPKKPSLFGRRSILIRYSENWASRKLAARSEQKIEAANAVASPTLTSATPTVPTVIRISRKPRAVGNAIISRVPH